MMQNETHQWQLLAVNIRRWHEQVFSILHPLCHPPKTSRSGLREILYGIQSHQLKTRKFETSFWKKGMNSFGTITQVTVLQNTQIRYSMANDFVHRSTATFWEVMVPWTKNVLWSLQGNEKWSLTPVGLDNTPSQCKLHVLRGRFHLLLHLVHTPLQLRSRLPFQDGKPNEDPLFLRHPRPKVNISPENVFEC